MMKDKGKTKEQLIEELEDLHKQIIELKEPKTNIAKAEDMLKYNEERYRRIVETANEGIWIIDAESKTTFANKKMSEMLGYNVEEMIGLSLFEFMDEEWREIAKANVERRMQGIIEQHDFKFRRKDGGILWTIVSANPFFDKEGRYIGALGMITDITDYKRSVEKIHNLNSELEQRVVERTAELEATNETLRSEITERRRAEEELRQGLEKLRKTLEGTVNALSATVELRDPYTGGHQRRVAKLACAIAREIGFSDEQIEEINVSGSLHDIGKMYVPAEILNKPGCLTELEMGLIKIHSQAGYDILKVIEFPWPIAQIVLQHHERMNGSGYPSGLYGKDILLEARILTVADVVEAMASYRPYRPAQDIDKALEEISQNRDVLYDSDVVNACLRLFKEKGFSLD